MKVFFFLNTLIETGKELNRSELCILSLRNDIYEEPSLKKF